LEKSILAAFANGGISSSDVDLVCAHGAGTNVSDIYEANTILKIFSNSNKAAITALKSYIGHNLGGSALLETAILLLSLKSETIIPTLNSDNTNPTYNISLVREKIKKKIKIVMKICAAFAGYNAAAIFRRPD